MTMAMIIIIMIDHHHMVVVTMMDVVTPHLTSHHPLCLLCISHGQECALPGAVPIVFIAVVIVPY